ncbi:MAG: SRPBCC family protein [Myxococcales bacterium]|nr:SRPBCC family protein [Myxococcales bacterium]
MSTLTIEERIVINAPVERVWQFLLDPERVVQCLPGATYDGAESEHVFLGHMKVKVGPVTTLFAGKATMSEIDGDGHTVKILGEGKDKNGAGTAKLTMTGAVVAVDGGSELRVVADVDIAGKLVTFGRGLIKAVSAQLFKQFSARAQAMLEQEPEAAAEAAPAEAVAAAAPAEAAEPAPTGAAEVAPDAAPAPAAAASTDAPTGPATGDDAPVEAAPTAAPAPATKPVPTDLTTTASPFPGPQPARSIAKRPPSEEATLNALPLLVRAIGASIAGFFRRLFRFGRKPKGPKQP